MHIRPATLADYESLLALDTVAQHKAERVEQIRIWIQAGHCYALEKNGLLGYGVLNYQFFGYGFVAMLMVGEAGRRQGGGTAILRYFREHCRTEKLFSSTNQSNQAMHGLFLKLGFQCSGIIENLDENDPEIVYVSLSRQSRAVGAS